MSVREPDFASRIAIIVKRYPFYANRNAEMTTIKTALGSDVTTHDKTIESVAAALKIHSELQTHFTNDINHAINWGKGGNLPNATMVAVLDQVLGVLSPPGVVDIPYAHAGATPPIVGTVCTCTTGNWIGTPTSYAYQWTRSGANIAGATAASYTLVSADLHTGIRCVVTATNAQGSTTAPPSNVITVP
jgi:hypothetical protein